MFEFCFYLFSNSEAEEEKALARERAEDEAFVIAEERRADADARKSQRAADRAKITAFKQAWPASKARKKPCIFVHACLQQLGSGLWSQGATRAGTGADCHLRGTGRH